MSKEKPYEILLEIDESQLKDLKKGNKFWWFIKNKKKLGYCEISLELKKQKGDGE